MRQRAFIIAGMGVALILIGTSIKSGWLYLASSILFSIVILGIFSGWFATRKLDGMREAPTHAFDGDTMPVTLRLRNNSRVSRYFLLVRDLGWDRRGSERIGFGNIAPDEVVTAEYTVEVPQRGVYRNSVISVANGGVFGIGQYSRKSTIPAPLIVYPRVHYIESFPFEAVMSTTPVENMEWARQGADRDFYGVREYVRGDSLKDVHWKSSARLGKLIVREYQREFKPYAGVVVAVEEEARPARARDRNRGLEAALSAAASILNYYDTVGASVAISSLSTEECGIDEDVLKDSATSTSFFNAEGSRGVRPGDALLLPGILFEPELGESMEHLARYCPPREGLIAPGRNGLGPTPFSSAVAAGVEALPAGSTIVIVTNIDSAALAREMNSLRFPNSFVVVAAPSALFGSRVSVHA